MSLFFFFGGQAKTWLVGINVWKKQSFCITTVTTVQASIKTTTQFRSVLVTCLDLYSLHSSSVIPNIQLVWSEQRACNLQTWVGLTLPQSKRCEKSMFSDAWKVYLLPLWKTQNLSVWITSWKFGHPVPIHKDSSLYWQFYSCCQRF